MLDAVKGPLAQALPQGDYTRRFSDGTEISVKAIRNLDMKVDLIRIKVPSEAVAMPKREEPKKKKLRLVEQTTESPIPEMEVYDSAPVIRALVAAPGWKPAEMQEVSNVLETMLFTGTVSGDTKIEITELEKVGTRWVVEEVFNSTDNAPVNAWWDPGASQYVESELPAVVLPGYPDDLVGPNLSGVYTNPSTGRWYAAQYDPPYGWNTAVEKPGILDLAGMASFQDIHYITGPSGSPQDGTGNPWTYPADGIQTRYQDPRVQTYTDQLQYGGADLITPIYFTDTNELTQWVEGVFTGDSGYTARDAWSGDILAGWDDAVVQTGHEDKGYVDGETWLLLYTVYNQDHDWSDTGSPAPIMGGGPVWPDLPDPAFTVRLAVGGRDGAYEWVWDTYVDPTYGTPYCTTVDIYDFHGHPVYVVAVYHDLNGAVTYQYGFVFKGNLLKSEKFPGTANMPYEEHEWLRMTTKYGFYGWGLARAAAYKVTTVEEKEE